MKSWFFQQANSADEMMDSAFNVRNCLSSHKNLDRRSRMEEWLAIQGRKRE
jgi:hypothetical protein